MKVLSAIACGLAMVTTSRLAAADPPALACTPEVNAASEISIHHTQTGLVATDDPDKHHGSAIAYPFDATHILLAWQSGGHYGHPIGSDLYLVDCKAPDKPKVYASGDFGHSVLLPDGKTLVFSDGEGRGIGLLEIATKKAKGLTYPPAFKPDSMECDGREPGLHDIIVSFDVDADVLEFERGGSCGFEGDWTSTRYFLDHLSSKPSKPRKGAPIAIVAAGAGDTAWAALGPCEGPKTAVVWSSADLGATWMKHAVPKAASGIGEIIADAKQAGRVAVMTGTCGPGPMGDPMFVGGRLHVTADGGATWKLVDLPTKSADNATAGLTVAPTDGSLDHLTLWGPNDAGEDTMMWTSRDGGAHWQEAPKRLALPAPPGPVKIGDATLEPSTDGILVKHAKGPATRAHPYTTP